MLEILAIYHFSRKVGDIAKEKGYSRGWYIFFFIIFWLIGEMLGGIAGGLLATGPLVYLFALIGAGLGGLIFYFIVNTLSNKKEVGEALDSNLN